MEEERRRAPAQTAAWQAISEYRLLAASLNTGFTSLLNKTVQWCQASGGCFALLRDGAISIRAGSGVAVGDRPAGSLFGIHDPQAQNPLIIPDVSQDSRSRTSPELAGDEAYKLNIGLYASMPVRAPNDTVVGVLSVFDQFSAASGSTDAAMLQGFAQVFEQFLARRNLQDLDADTGLLSRVAFERAFTLEWQAAMADRDVVNLLMFSLPGLGRVSRRHGQATGESLMMQLAGLIKRRLVMSRLLFGRVSGSSVAVILPSRVTETHVQSTVDAVRGDLSLPDGMPIEAAAGLFCLLPREAPAQDPAQVLRAAERCTALRGVCRHAVTPRFSLEQLRGLDNSLMTKNSPEAS